MHISNMMLLPDLHKRVEEFTRALIKEDEYRTGCCFLPEDIKGLMFAEQHQLGELIKNDIIRVPYTNLHKIPHIPEVVVNSDVFKDLPITLVKKIFSRGFAWDAKDVFVFWLSGNECTEDDKWDILDNIELYERIGELLKGLSP